MPDSRTDKRRTLLPALLVLIAVLGWLSCTVAQLEKYVQPLHAALLCAAGAAGTVATLLLLRRLRIQGRDIGWAPLIGLFLVIVMAFGLLYPKSLDRRAEGKGSDREDALQVELHAIVNGRYPYAARTFMGNPPTPLPGAMWLASPFYFAGLIALQNIVWLGLFLLFLTKYFKMRSTAFAFVFLFILAALENLNDFVVGGDYITNIMYVAIALFMFSQAVDRPRSDWKTWLAVLLLGFALSSRAVFAVVLPLIVAFALQCTSRRRAVVLIGGVVLTSALVTVPIFMPHPVEQIRQQLSHNSSRLQLLPAYLPALSFLIACLGFFLRLNLQRLFLLLGMANLATVLPYCLLLVSQGGGFTAPINPDVEYVAIGVLFVTLWAFARWECLWQPRGGTGRRNAQGQLMHESVQIRS